MAETTLSSTCLVRDDHWLSAAASRIQIGDGRLALAAGSLVGCFLLWHLFRWTFSIARIDVVRACCGHNAAHGLDGYDADLPDAEVIPEAKDRDDAITVYVAKEIVTMDPTWPSVKVVACQYGRILGVGQTLEDLDPWLTREELDPSDVVVDRTFEDDVVVPGFIEQHGHPLVGGTALSLVCVAFHDTAAPYRPVIPGCKSKKEVIDRLREEHDKRPLTDGSPDEEMLLAWGFDSIAMGCHLTKGDLDEIDPGGRRRIFVWDCSMHFAYVNTPMMERTLELDVKNGRKYAKSTVGVQIDPQTGELAGAFFGVNAVTKFCFPLVSHVMRPSQSLESIHHLTEVARMGGITTMCELMLGSVNLTLEMDLYKWFYNNDLTPCRCVCTVMAKKAKQSMSPFRLPLPDARAYAAARWIKGLQAQSTEKLIFSNGVKFFADDAFVGLTMQMRFPGYVEPTKRRGIWNMEAGGPGAPFVREMLPFWREGCRIHVHSNGDASQDALTEAVQTLQAIHPRFDHRFSLEHYGMSALHLHRRLKNLGVNVGVNVHYAYARGQLNEAHLGKDKAHAASRLKSMVDAGLVVAMHADTPVAPPRPLEEIWFACNRMADPLDAKNKPASASYSDAKTKGGDASSSGSSRASKRMIPICPAERITPYQALRMKTADAAYVHGLDGILGSIEAGKFADFTVLAENPLDESNRASLRDIRVIATVVGGVKRTNVVQRRRVPAPPGEGLVGQVLWLRAMSIVGTGVASTFCRWALLTVASWMGSSGTLEDATQKTNQKAGVSATSCSHKNNNQNPNRNLDDEGFGLPCDECQPIICKHIKPKHRLEFKFRCC